MFGSLPLAAFHKLTRTCCVSGALIFLRIMAAMGDVSIPRGKAACVVRMSASATCVSEAFMSRRRITKCVATLS
eukprot:1221711-Amphidinium_carterae.1